MKSTRKLARLLSAVMAFAMIFALAAPAGAEGDAVSVEVVMAGEGMELSGKIAVSPQLAMSVGACMLANGQSLADLTAFLSTQAIAVQSGFLDRAYGVSLPDLSRNLEGSVFAPNSGSRFALDEDSYNALQDMLNGGLQAKLPELSGAMDTDALTSAASAVGAALTQAFAGVASKLTVESAPDTVTLGGRTVSVTRAKITAGTDVLLGISDSLLTSLEGSTELQGAVAVLADALFAISGEKDGVSGQELVGSLLEQMDSVRQSVADELSGAQPAIAITVCTAGSQLPVKLALDITSGGDTVSVQLLMSEEKDFFRLNLVDSDGSVDALQLEIPESTDEALNLCLTSYEDEDMTFALSLRLDKTGKTFKVTVTNVEIDSQAGKTGTRSNSLSGFYDITDTLFTVTVDKADDQPMGFTVALNIRTDDTVDMPAFTELTGLGEAEVSSALEGLMGGLQGMAQLFGLGG